MEKLYRSHLLVCGGAGCVSSGCLDVAEALRREIDRNALQDEVKIVLTGCMGSCDIGPVAMVAPDGTFYQKLKPQDATKIVEEHLLKGRVVKELLRRNGHSDDVYLTSEDMPFFKLQRKLVLRNCGIIDPGNIDEYIARDGYSALAKVLTEMQPQEVIDEIKKSGLRGRGGGGFPTGVKWQFTKDAKSEQKFVVCNADEGDPGAFMDRSLLEGDPHSVIEGMIIAGYAIGADTGYIYVRAEYPLAIERLTTALKQAKEYGILGNNVLQTGHSFSLDIRIGAGAFVCGEETALMASIEGKRGEPRPRPPYPAISGLWKSPTLLNNVETYANVPVILGMGAEEYAKIGTEKSKGTKIFALAGAINNTGLVEVPMGTSLGTIIYDIGGGIRGGRKFKAAQAGGPSGGCIPKEHLNVPMDYDSLVQLGAMMGSGGLIIMDENTCMVDLARYFLEFIQDESCGKCTPCRVGTKRMLEILDRIAHGEGKEGDIELLIDLGERIKDSALCGLGQTAPNPILSTIRYFRDEYEAHIRDKKCPACVCSSLFEAPCAHACPAGTSVPKYIALISQRRFSDALRIIRDHNPFPAVCGRVCNAPCESKCQRSQVDEPLAIRNLKRFVADVELKERKLPPIRTRGEGTGKKVAIVGGGPAGLTAAYHLARMGHEPTVYEALPEAGGMLMWGIPEYRLPKDVLRLEIKAIEELGVTIKTGTKVGRDITMEQIKADFDAVFLATGADKSWKLEIPGEELKGVYDSITFLRDVQLGNQESVGKNVAVVGGGNAAIDAARTAKRLGAETVTIVYRRLRGDMPADPHEIAEAENEGIDIRYLTTPAEIIGENGKVKALRCQLLQLAEFDKSGRRSPKPIEGGYVDLPVDAVISAISQEPDLDYLGDDSVQISRGKIVVDRRSAMTSCDGIFAGGDVVSGPATVIEAIGAGVKAAQEIDRYLGGNGQIPSDIEDIAIPPAPDDVEDIKETPRAKMRTLPIGERSRCAEVELGFTRDEAIAEANRCLRCDATS
ncbi:MAG: NADH-quinone oxidoreductase subunit NuoF [Armatimonadetes bacterium]|nr:NADH-quinone oxidoreductase subunit NuoF [Armatimonadota bacterium]